MIEGILFAVAHVYLPGLLALSLGSWITKYKPLVPIRVIFFVLMLEPRWGDGALLEALGLQGEAGRPPSPVQQAG